MKPLETVYWFRFLMGFIAALLCLGFVMATVPARPLPRGVDFNIFLNSVSLSVITYLLSYYALKSRFKDKVAKPSKILTTGIGVYFLSWIVFYVLLYTAFSGI
jgi:hypothetical protein